MDPGDIQHPSHEFVSKAEERRAAGRNRTLPDEEIRNRFGYHAGTSITQPKHQLVRARFSEMCVFLDELLPAGRAKNVAFAELESTAMWANKAIAEMAPVVQE